MISNSRVSFIRLQHILGRGARSPFTIARRTEANSATGVPQSIAVDPSRRNLWWALAALILAGCATPSPAELRSAIPGSWMTCNRPYIFTQNCSTWSGATREIEINGVEMKIAGTADGRVVLVFPTNVNSHAFRGDLNQASGRAVHEVYVQLQADGVAIEHKIPVKSGGNFMGYVLELDRDGYSLLTMK